MSDAADKLEQRLVLLSQQPEGELRTATEEEVVDILGWLPEVAGDTELRSFGRQDVIVKESWGSTSVEQQHIGDALIFELSKVERPDIRARMVSHLINIDEALAQRVADGLRLPEMPKAAQAAREPKRDLEPSPALSILKNGPESFAGRTVGILLTDGADAQLLKQLSDALKKEGAQVKLVAPRIGGVKTSDGAMVAANEKIDGGPSVLFDAVALLVSEEGAKQLAEEPAARDFVADALAHHKFIAHTQAASSLLKKAGADRRNGGQLVSLANSDAVQKFVERCRALRSWPKEDGN